MDAPVNHAEPLIMHIDLNACFAHIEQQANPLLRGKPTVVAAYTTPNGCVLSPSYEAKRLGIKTGMRVRDARLLCPEVVVLSPDPPKYRAVHIQFRKLFRDYSPVVIPKSIDEAVLDFSGTPTVRESSLVGAGYEIKRRMQGEIGEWLTCNVGISTNRFLAKTAAGLHKPDGLDVITHENLREVYATLELRDFPGINYRYEARLNAHGIYTPLEFLDAPLDVLKKQVFKGITGYYWYLRLRGWEIDQAESKRQSYGQSYALKVPTDSSEELSHLLMKLTEKMGRRLRAAGYEAGGVHMSCVYRDGRWHKGCKASSSVCATQDLYLQAQGLLELRPRGRKVANLAVSCFDLIRNERPQMQLFDTDRSKLKRLAGAMDAINDRFGEFTITPALMMEMNSTVLDRIAFGGVRELQDS
jgi:DNA polymerase-4